MSDSSPCPIVPPPSTGRISRIATSVLQWKQSAGQLINRHPVAAVVVGFCSLVFIALPQWVSGVWALFSDEPMFRVIGRWLSVQMPSFNPYLITIPVGLGLLLILIYLTVVGQRAARSEAQRALSRITVGVVPQIAEAPQSAVKGSRWPLLVLVVLLVIAIALGLFSYLNRRAAQLEGPALTEVTKDVTLIIGTNGFAISMSELNAAKDGTQIPFGMNGQLPIRLALQGTKIAIEADIYAGPNQAAAHISHNQFRNQLTFPQASDWDVNMSKTALEIVDDRQRVVFQLIHKRPSQIEINGIFPTDYGIILCTTEGQFRGLTGYTTRFTLDGIFAAGFRLKPIFRYPSWKYGGMYADDASEATPAGPKK